jgi:crotonobetainyl-CoA:carnitine CoA-transferase CaiB-like acyl-CoA transferase
VEPSPLAALRTLHDAVGLGPPPEGTVRSTGHDPVFPVPHRIGTAAAVAAAAAAVRVDRRWRRFHGERQLITVDLRAAAASTRGFHYLRLDGEVVANPRAPLTGFYPTADGRWIFLHLNFAAHRERITQVLGCRATAEELRRACSWWDAEALEHAIQAAGATAGLFRTPAQWRTHPQHRAVADLPPVTIRRTAAGPVPASPPGARPLTGLRVLDLTRVLAGPTCGRTLAEHGADIVRLVSPRLEELPAYAFDTDHGKRTHRVDLDTAGGRDTLDGLLDTCDVLVEAFRPGAMLERGLGPEALAARRPGSIHVSLRAFDEFGPWGGRKGFDSVVQSVTGMARGPRDGHGPTLLPVSAVDYVAGYLLAFGTLVALERREVEGGSYAVSTSLARIADHICSYGLAEPAAVARCPEELSPQELRRLTTTTATPAGRLEHLRPIARMSRTPPGTRWPPSPPRDDAPRWIG